MTTLAQLEAIWDPIDALAKQHVIEWDAPFHSCPGGVTEHLVHELAHASSLDLLPWAHDTATHVSIRCSQMKDKGREEEARAWVIEWGVIQMIGLDFGWADVVEEASVQDVKAERLNQLRNLRQFKIHAQRVLEELERLLEWDFTRMAPKLADVQA